MTNNFLTNEMVEMKSMQKEEIFERFHQFLLDKNQHFLILPVKNRYFSGKLKFLFYTKFILNGVTVIYEQENHYFEKEHKILNILCSEKNEYKYAGIFIEKTGKLYDEPDFLFVEENRPEWCGGFISDFKNAFKKECEERIRKELLEKYKTAEDIPDSLLSNPVSEEYFQKNRSWKEYYFKNKPMKFIFEIYNSNHLEYNQFSQEDTISYIINPEETVNNFVAHYNKTDALQKLKIFYIKEKLLAEFVPSKVDIIKKEIFQAIFNLKGSVKNVHLYIKGRDSNRSRYMGKSIEGTIIECMYPTDNFFTVEYNELRLYSATNWSVKTGKRYSQEPIHEIYFEDIVKITSNKKTIYEKKEE